MNIFKRRGPAWQNFIPAALWVGIVIYLSLAPSSSLKTPAFFKIPHSDKVVHLIFYMGMSITVLWGILKSGWYQKKYFWYTIVGCGLFGFAVELLQHTERINRHFEMLDIIANIIGALLGAVLFLKFYKLLPNGSRN